MHKKKHNSKAIRGKLRVCNYLSSNKKLKKHVPHTVLFTKSNLESMARKYHSVYIKLDIGSMGIGVYKMTCLSEGYRLYATHNKKQIQKRFQTIAALYKHLKSKTRKIMIIQRDIFLDRVKGRPYDIRAMVQRKPGKKWTCTGFLIKVGAPGKIVTNYYQGGKIYTIKKLLKLKKYTLSQRRAKTQKLIKKALKVARVLSEKRSGMHEMGIDFAYDRKHRLWILEVNSNYPQFRPLRKLDRTAYKRMKSFARSYGRQ